MLHYNYSGIEIDALAFRSSKYSNFPSCQRDYCWPIGMQRKFVDSIFRGIPIPPLTLIPVDDPLNGTTYLVVDGQQRLKTIFRYLNDEFSTAKDFRDEPLIKPICPNKKYSELEPVYKTKFDNYKLQVCMIDGVDPVNIELVYRRMNYQISLKFPERLYSYQSPAKKIAESIESHPVWSSVYIGDKDRKQVYQMILMAILMETYDAFCNMTTPRLLDVAAGATGRDISRNIGERINKRLNAIQSLFKYSDFRGINHFIPIYQAIMLLDDDGFDLTRSKEGCLSSWFNEHRAKTLETQRIHNFPNLYSVLNHAGEQRKFWLENLSIVESVAGLVRLDKKRNFDALQKLQAWVRQGGKCIKCGKSLSPDEDGHHAIPHSEGGSTSHDNCQLVHKKCHQEITLGI